MPKDFVHGNRCSRSGVEGLESAGHRENGYEVAFLAHKARDAVTLGTNDETDTALEVDVSVVLRVLPPVKASEPEPRFLYPDLLGDW